MIKAKAIMDFTLGKFEELENLERANPINDDKGSIYIGDTFECDEEMAKYLCGGNDYGLNLIEILEVAPEEETKEEEVEEETKDVKPKKSRRKKK